MVVLALLAGLSAWLASVHVFRQAPITSDEQSYIFQAFTFAEGKLKREAPALIQPFRYLMTIVDEQAGWLSRYPPGHGLWLTPGAWLNNFYLMTALAAALGAWWTARAGQLTGAHPCVVLALLLASPTFILTNGTLLSHVSGYLAAALLFFAYVCWHEKQNSVWALVAGAAWSWLFLNRTYTALLMAIPFALHALIFLGRSRSWPALRGTLLFAGSAAAGVVALLIYNYLAVGHPLKMTYLFYDPTDNLGFGLRHHGPVYPGPKPVLHTPAKGLQDLMSNLALLDRWLFGFRGGLVVLCALVATGWSRRWSLLLVTPFLMVAGGYIIFWYPGWNETGPNYYFETLPGLMIAAAMGLIRIWGYALKRRILIPVVAVAVLCWLVSSALFVRDVSGPLRERAMIRRQALDTMMSAPDQSLVLVRGRVMDPAWMNNDMVFNPRGLHSQVIIARWMDGVNQALVSLFPGFQTMLMHYDPDRGFYLENFTLSDEPFDVRILAERFHAHTGSNQVKPDGSGPVVKVADRGDQAGLLMFGRYFYVAPGQYVAEVAVEYADPGAATFDLTQDQGRSVLLVRPLPQRKEPFTEQFSFAVDKVSSLEPRVHYHGSGRVEITGVRLRMLNLADQSRD